MFYSCVSSFFPCFCPTALSPVFMALIILSVFSLFPIFLPHPPPPPCLIYSLGCPIESLRPLGRLHTQYTAGPSSWCECCILNFRDTDYTYWIELLYYFFPWNRPLYAGILYLNTYSQRRRWRTDALYMPMTWSLTFWFRTFRPHTFTPQFV
jgi:hypothetical protein